MGEFSLINYIYNEQWKAALCGILDDPRIRQIEYILAEYYTKGHPVYPNRYLIFNALNMTPLNKIRVVIVGQDPYDGGKATGLAFSVLPESKHIPPSLLNIYEALTRDFPGFQSPNHGCLDAWANNGLLLLNSFLTKISGEPGIHNNKPSDLNELWQELTDAVIRTINDCCSGVVFLLFGRFAWQKRRLIEQPKHTVIEAHHPAPHAGSTFFQTRCFLKTEIALQNYGKPSFNWNLY